MAEEYSVKFTGKIDNILSRCPKKLDATLLIICTQGQARFEMDGRNFRVMPNDMLFCFRQSTINSFRPAPDFLCDVVIIAPHTIDDILFSCVRDTHNLPQKWDYLVSHPLIRLTESQMRLKYSFTNIVGIFRQHSHSSYGHQIARALTEVIIYEVLTWVENKMDRDSTQIEYSRGELMFRKFFSLVQEQHGAIREVQWYADQLAISPKYLTFLCKKYTGGTALKVISEETMREIRRELLSSDDSVKEIAFRMKFPNLTFFCKYVKQHFGMSPGELRASQRNNTEI